ncbi:MAG: hypothetical protein GY774_35715 [Planctomycetes bacterium]|nr:hypothetical protein [Planctomycetota bacterium]
MEIVRDLVGGNRPPPINVFYNAQDDADGSETRYKGSLCKLMDWDNAAGIQVTGAIESTTLENIFGILEEEVSGASGYLLNDADYGAITRKVTPILPTSIIRGEYARNDAAGSANLESTATAAAAGTTVTGTTTDIDTDDLMVGGWLYFTNGANANKLHYVTDSADSGETLTIATALSGALVATDDFIVVQAPMTLWMALDATLVHLGNTVDDGARTLPVMGLMSYLTAPGIPFQRLDRNLHDGLTIANARFYHDFIIGGSATLGNVWRDTIIRA